MKKLLENIKIYGSMVIIGALLLYIATTIFMPDLTLKIFQFKPYNVVTESMEPVINVNDVVVVTNFNLDEAQVGDIITFSADIDYNGTEEIVTHYIYSIEETDGEVVIRTHRHFENAEETVPDTWLISPDQVIGSYAFQIPYLGFIMGFLKSIYGIVTVAVNVVLISTVVYLHKKSKREEQQQLEEVKNISEPKANPVTA